MQIMKNILFIICFFIAVRIFPQEVYTTGINLKKTDWNKISIQWKSNIEKGIFGIYRNNKFPISSILILSNSTNIYSEFLTGTKDNDLYKFPPFVDSDLAENNYFYIVLLKSTNYSGKDLIYNLNYNFNPIQIKKDFNPLRQQGIIKNLYINTNAGTIYLFWNIDKQVENTSFLFSVYRSTNIVSNENQLKYLQPYKIVKNEYYLEDSDIRFGIPYYYTIIVNDNKIIIPGINQNTNGIFIGSKNIAVKVEREIFIEKKVSTREFISNFEE